MVNNCHAWWDLRELWKSQKKFNFESPAGQSICSPPFWPQIVHVVESTLSEVDMFLPHYVGVYQIGTTNIGKAVASIF